MREGEGERERKIMEKIKTERKQTNKQKKKKENGKYALLPPFSRLSQFWLLNIHCFASYSYHTYFGPLQSIKD